MKILFIATLPARHFTLYGKSFLEKSEEVLTALNASNENFLKMEVSIDHLPQLTSRHIKKYKHIKLIDYYDTLYGRDEFVEQVKVPDETSLDIAGDVSKQIIRWSYKGMMQIYYLKNECQNYDYIIYIDADTTFTKNLLFTDLVKILPDQTELLSAVFRHDINKYTETGWISWNTQHSHYQEWVQIYTEGWKTHIYEVLDAYHDCAIFDWACGKMSNVNYKNLSGGGGHGFNSGILGKFIDHKKGIRKHLGFSYEKLPILNTRFGLIVYKFIFGIYIKVKKFSI